LLARSKLKRRNVELLSKAMSQTTMKRSSKFRGRQYQDTSSLTMKEESTLEKMTQIYLKRRRYLLATKTWKMLRGR
jgi:hypothetical protein